MAAAGDTLQINSGNTVLDKKIGEWLEWDKVRMNTSSYTHLIHYVVDYIFEKGYSWKSHSGFGDECL